MIRNKLLLVLVTCSLLMFFSCGLRKETFICHCFTIVTSNSGTSGYEGEITTTGAKGEGVAAFAKKNKYTNDGNGNSEDMQCTLK
ncbi:MAG: hypothetical protein IPF62_00445 [Bacteroidetes bacterium]|nr:hypothetical protein [Bacteroidota bacterium]